MSDSLRPHGLQHARLPCLSLSPRACSNSCPLSCWCHTTISSCHPLLLLTSIFPSIRVLSQPFTSGGQRIGASAQHQFFQWIFRTDFLRTDWFYLLELKGLSRVFSNTTVQRHQFFSAQPSLWSSSHIWYMTPRKTIALTIWTFVGKVICLLFNMLSRFVIAILPRSKHHH